MPAFLHILLAIVAGALAGALWAGIAGFLKATVGAHEVITTIMLNWIANWVGATSSAAAGRCRTTRSKFVPISDDVVEGAKLPVFWGNPLLQALHVGIFIALAALVVYWIILNRTTLGYEVRAVGFNPEAARYGGISVARNYFLAMAISGALRRARAARSTSSAGSSGSARSTSGLQDRLHRHRRRAARAQHGGRRRARRAALRRAPHRHLDPQPRPGDLPARARRGTYAR